MVKYFLSYIFYEKMHNNKKKKFKFKFLSTKQLFLHLVKDIFIFHEIKFVLNKKSLFRNKFLKNNNISSTPSLLYVNISCRLDLNKKKKL